MISGNARFAILVFSLAGAALFLPLRTNRHSLRPQAAAAALPIRIADWVGTDLPFLPKTLATLGPGQFVQRSFQKQKSGEPYVDLYVAYHPDRTALDSHLPSDCLIGSGWSPAESDTTTLSLPGNAPFTANRYLISRGSDRQLVLFWFWVHGRSLASENWADFYLTLDSLRLNRNDYAVVRINTPLSPGETAHAAQQRLLSFADQLSPLLNQYLSR